MNHVKNPLRGAHAEIEILLPIGERPAAEGPEPVEVSARLAALEGKVVGIVSNGWHCMRVIADEYSGSLAGRYGTRGVRIYETPATMAMSPDLSGRIAAECDAAIVGIGN